ncbi:MAG: DUF1320 family protein [Magnetococcales bacterium]|nr:DUF1320 family protein [Magnetococcales bacterium]
MTLASVEDLLLWFGARELAQVAVPEELPVVSSELMRLTIVRGERDAFTDEEITAADAGLGVIERALADATRLIESHVALRHAIPLSGAQVAGSPLPRVCGAIARRLLHRDRVPEEVIAGHTQAMNWLKALAAGQVGIVGGAVHGAGAAAFEAPPRLFDHQTLRGFV